MSQNSNMVGEAESVGVTQDSGEIQSQVLTASLGVDGASTTIKVASIGSENNTDRDYTTDIEKPTDGSNSNTQSFNTADNDNGEGSTDDQSELTPQPWTEMHQSALQTLRSNFGDIDPMVLSKLVFQTAPRLSLSSCQFCGVWCDSTRFGYDTLMWTCLQSLYPEFSYQAIRIAASKDDLKASLDIYVGRNSVLEFMNRYGTHSLTRGISAMDPSSVRWEGQKLKLESCIAQMESTWRKIPSVMRQIDPAIDTFVLDVKSGIEDMIDSLQKSIIELKVKQTDFDQATKLGADETRSTSGNNMLGLDIEAQGTYAQTATHSKRNGKRSVRMQFHLAMTNLKSYLGNIRVMSVIMAVLCLAGLGANIISVYKWTASGDTPLIDSNFWSTFAQSNIGIAAIYSVIIPQLQTGQSPVLDKWRWLFKCFLWFSVLTALLATIIYPWHGGTSIVAGFVSCVTQLSVTLQMILSAGKKIQSLEEEIGDLREDVYGARKRR